MTDIPTDTINNQMGQVREEVTRLSTEHRDLHSSVSKVGKAIDKVCNINFLYINIILFLIISHAYIFFLNFMQLL